MMRRGTESGLRIDLLFDYPLPATQLARHATTVKTRSTILRVASEPDLLRLVPLLDVLLPIDQPDNDLTRQMQGKVRADNTLALLVALLNKLPGGQKTAAGPAAKVLVLEDAHWLDSASWALLQLVSQQVRPLLLVVAKAADASGNSVSLGYSVAHHAALTFVTATAEELGLPVVINVSQGMNAGAHDGSSALEAGFEEITGSGRTPGVVIVKSAGNAKMDASRAFALEGL